MKSINNFLYNLRLFIFKNYREDKIVQTLKIEIQDLQDSIINKKKFKVLDIGSGMQPYVINKLINELNIRENIDFIADCYDFYTKDMLKKININKKLKFFHLNRLESQNNYDFILIIDVLHHIGVDDLAAIKNLLNKISKKGRYIIIKDHFEYSFFSRFLLIIMDFVGNYFNGVKIPKCYFTINKYNILIKELKLIEIKRITNIHYYKKIWLFFSNPKLQFISILKLNHEN